MQAPGWTKAALLLLLVSLAGTTIFCIVLMGKLDGATARLARLEDRLDEMALRRNEATSRGPGADAGDARFGELEASMGTMALKLRANSKRLDRLEAGDLGDLGIEALIDRKLDETIAMRTQGPLGKRPGIDELGEALGLTDRQKQRIASLLDGAKGRVYEVMSADMGDGRDMMDNMTETMRGKGSRKEKTRKILSEMFDNVVPGSDESYFSTLMDIRTNSVSGFQSVLTADQLASFKGLNIDVFGINTGYSPFSAEIEQILSGAQ